MLIRRKEREVVNVPFFMLAVTAAVVTCWVLVALASTSFTTWYLGFFVALLVLYTSTRFRWVRFEDGELWVRSLFGRHRMDRSRARIATSYHRTSEGGTFHGVYLRCEGEKDAKVTTASTVRGRDRAIRILEETFGLGRPAAESS